MAKAFLFDFRDARIYFDACGISPETHSGRLCADTGGLSASAIVDAGMIKAWQRIIERRKRRKKRTHGFLFLPPDARSDFPLLYIIYIYYIYLTIAIFLTHLSGI